MTDDSSSREDAESQNRYGQLRLEAADQDVLSALSSAPEHQHTEGADALDQLLIGYSHTLDFIAAEPPIVFLSFRPIPLVWFDRRLLLPRANFTASILAVMHIADRVDILLRRGQRFRALHSHEPNPLDLDRLQDFRNSLSPVRQRTLVVWIALATLAVAFPVAWITDRLRILAPEAIVCSSRFSIRAAIARFVGTSLEPITSGCRPGSKTSLVHALVIIAHSNLTPGGIIDAFSSVRGGGVVDVLLIAVVLILSLSVVLLVFKSGFRLKRLAFTAEEHPRVLSRLPNWSEIRSDGLYCLERDEFSAVGLPYPREFPLDLAVRAGLLTLPLTISLDLLNTARSAKLDIVTKAMLVVGALAFIAFVGLQVHWLVQVWRSRNGSKLIGPRQRWLPDGSIVLAHSGAYGVVLMATGFIIIEITAIADPGISLPYKIFSILFLGPIFTWALGPFLWYRLHREFAAYSRCIQLAFSPAPMLSMIPPLSLAVVVIIGYIFINNNGTNLAVDFSVTAAFLVGFIGMPMSIYRMGRNLEQLRRGAAHRDRKARIAGLRVTPLLLVPFAAILYFRRSLNQIASRLAAPKP